MIQTDDLELFGHIKEAHPNWSDNQNWVNVSMMREAERAVNEGGVDVNNLTEVFIRTLVKRAQEWIGENLPDILEKVSQYFIDIWNHIGEWVSHGLNWLMDTLGDILGSIDL